MLKAQRGYTIVEVLIVLTVSSVLFFGVYSIFAPRRQGVEFSQGIYDVQSKIEQLANQVSTGNFLEVTSYTCAQNAITQRPSLTASGSAVRTNSNQDCIYLGKALQPVIGSSDMYIYDILGLRNVHSGLSDTGESVQTIAEAKPEPAGSVNGAGNFQYLYSDKYTVPNGLKIISAKTNGSSGGILKLYSTLQNNNTSARGISAYSSNYTYQAGDEQPSNGANETSSRLRNCIEEISACTTVYPLEVNGWTLCLQGTDNTHTATLVVKPSATGIVTKLTVTACS